MPDYIIYAIIIGLISTAIGALIGWISLKGDVLCKRIDDNGHL